ncbi:DDE transposase, partial [Xanthomonas oryzae pv. oryzae]
MLPLALRLDKCILISPIPQPLVAGSATLRLDNAPSSR